MKDKVVGKIECGVCGHLAEFVLSTNATLQSFEEINTRIGKQRVKEAMEKARHIGEIHGGYCDCAEEAVIEFEENVLKDLELE